ncbi:MATE family efflux transporter [Listeria booriae]|uniref:MATE family efflux transporter n=1 Tax=Listeria booriae TaxID=1552123 RepID=A0A7X1DSW8_9LIST|nr:MATE family efflux transporter [Listeria booriae]MBC2373794.1 MATE family efflux transporter [Listeria booriae]
MEESQTTTKLSLFSLAWPIFIEQFLRVMISYVTVFMLGHYSDDAVAATGVANQILVISVIMFAFISVGVQILVAQMIGARKHGLIEQVITNGIVFSVMIGAIVSLIFLFLSTQFLTWMGLDPHLVEVGTPFLEIIGGTSILTAIPYAIMPILRTHGHVRQAMYIPVVAGLITVVGNYLVLYGPLSYLDLGVTGVGIATVVGNVVAIFLSIWLLHRHVDYRFQWHKFKDLSRRTMYSILRLGLPSAGENMSYAGSQLIVTAIIALMGTDALTTKVYASTVSQFVALFAISIGQASQIIIGRAVGAKEVDRAYKQGFRSWRIGLIIAVAVSVLIYIFSEPIMHLFTSNENIIAMTKQLFLLSIFLEIGRSTNIIIISSLNSTGDVRFPFIVGIIVMWIVSLPFSYALGITAGMGLVGVWLAYIIDEGLRGCLMVYRWRSKVWSLKSVL